MLLGFDSVVGTGDSINKQLPTQFQIVNPEGASIVPGRLTGKALRLTNGAYLDFKSNGNSKGYVIYTGCAFKASNVEGEQHLVQISHTYGGSYAPPYEEGNSYKSGDAFLVINNGNICLGDQNRTSLFPIVPNVYYYIELRHQMSTNRYNGSNPYVEVWINGINVHKTQQSYVYGSSSVSLALYWGFNSVVTGLDIDDLYFLYYATNSSYPQTYSDSYMPILAGGKINSIDLVSTQSNTFAVEGAATANEALSDANEATYISSQTAAEAVLNFDRNIGQVFSADLVVRGSSNTDGVLSMVMSDSTGADISGSKQTISLSSEPRLFSFSLAYWASSGKELREKMKVGTTFKVNT
ncbi:hypothetical protein [Vibrio jasicida]|uniref:hypothetical protein n=1 Tax=Vibrio jasicida TaxID=766224 RepID=UPI0005F00E27|nr:hypothetical protein [Vibrio jasicida]